MSLDPSPYNADAQCRPVQSIFPCVAAHAVSTRIGMWVLGGVEFNAPESVLREWDA